MIAALRTLAPVRVTVRRDGAEAVLDTVDVVPGDVVLLASGDVIPADCVVLEAHSLQADESALTGESVPVDVGVDAVLTGGAIVTRGRAVAEVVRTGANSGLGRIAALVGSAPQRPTPLQRRLSRLSAQLVLVAGVLVAVVLVLGFLQGQPRVETVITAVSAPGGASGGVASVSAHREQRSATGTRATGSCRRCSVMIFMLAAP